MSLFKLTLFVLIPDTISRSVLHKSFLSYTSVPQHDLLRECNYTETNLFFLPTNTNETYGCPCVTVLSLIHYIPYFHVMQSPVIDLSNFKIERFHSGLCQYEV